MKQLRKITSAVALAAIVAVLFTSCDLFVSDDFTYKSGPGELFWNDTRYVEIAGVETGPTKRVLARKPNQTAVIELTEDPSLTFLMVRHAGDTHYVVREDYVVPTEGEITAFLWGARYVTDETACNAMQEMRESLDTMSTFYHETDNLYALEGDAQTLKRVYLAYEGCPVTTDFVGFVGKVDGKFVYAEKPQQSVHTYQSDPPVTVKCYEIPQPLATTIASYLRFE